MRILVAAAGLLALLTTHHTTAQEPARQHPYSSSLTIKERVQNAMNYPRLGASLVLLSCMLSRLLQTSLPHS
jgi:hypothetical protein